MAAEVSEIDTKHYLVFVLTQHHFCKMVLGLILWNYVEILDLRHFRRLDRNYALSGFSVGSS